MKILAIDTATEACSVALLGAVATNDEGLEVTAQDDASPFRGRASEYAHIDAIFDICPQQHSQQILPMIDKLLRRSSLSVKDLTAIAYGCGPGSFTGVRIAASTVQGLAFGAELGVVQVSNLATMAQQVYAQTGIEEHLVLIDARMQEVYLGHYKIIDGRAVVQGVESVMSPDDALRYLNTLKTSQSSPAPIGLAGTGYVTYSDLFADDLKAMTLKVHYPNAKFMLPFATHALAIKSSISAENIEPVYVRDTVTWQKLPNKR